MEEKINLIKSNLTGDYNTDVVYLTSLYDAQNKIVEDSLATIEAVNNVLQEIQNEKENEENEENEEVEENTEGEQQEDTRSQEEIEIDSLIDELLDNVENESIDEALKNIEAIIPRIENLAKSDDEKVIYCSFSSDFEKMIFEYIFAKDKQVLQTPYANDVVYVMYSNLLLQKKKRKAAMDALNRAIYWNFLNRDAREAKIDLYFEKNEIVKCLEEIKKLQNISYTAQDLASCYNRYAYVFDSLKDPKSAYAVYRVSYIFYESEDVLNIINAYEDAHPEFKELTLDDIAQIAVDNEVEIGPNANIIKAHRDITTKLIQSGAIKEAKLMIENDYAMTKEQELEGVYNQLIELENKNSEAGDIQQEDDDAHDTEQEVNEEEEQEIEEEPANEENQEIEEGPKKTTPKRTAASKTTKKSTTTTKKRVAAKK